MTDPEHPTPRGDQPVDLTKNPDGGPEQAPFDPYRFGAPDVPPPPEYAPPGYVPPAAPPASAPPPYAGSPYQPYGPPPSGTGIPPYPQQPPYPHYPGSEYPGGHYPVPPGAPGYPPVRGGNGRAVTGLVLGILSLVLFWTSFLDAVLVVLAIIFGALGLSESKWKHVGRGQAIAGLICAAVGAVLAIVFTVWVVHVSRACDGYSSGSSAYERCIRNHL